MATVVIDNKGIHSDKRCFMCGKTYAFGRYNPWDYFEQCIECIDATPRTSEEIDRVLAAIRNEGFVDLWKRNRKTKCNRAIIMDLFSKLRRKND